MAGKPRKLWKTSYPKIDGTERRHKSVRDVYEYVRGEAELFKRGSLSSPRLNVYVDERDGNGWILFEDVNLEEWAKLDRTKG